MSENDHDLLIALNTRMDMVLKFMSEDRLQYSVIAGRVSALENKDSRDSEKVQAISKDVQQSLHNAERITILETEIVTIKAEVEKLRGRGYTWDVVNSVLIAISGFIGYNFGNR